MTLFPSFESTLILGMDMLNTLLDSVLVIGVYITIALLICLVSRGLKK